VVVYKRFVPMHTRKKMLLFCVKTVARECYNCELAHLKNLRRKKEHFGCLMTF